MAEAHAVMSRAGVCASHVGVAPYHHALNAISVWFNSICNDGQPVYLDNRSLRAKTCSSNRSYADVVPAAFV